MTILLSWTCAFCGESYFDENLARKHSLECQYNPDMKACETCSKLELEFSPRIKCICSADKLNDNKQRREHCSFWTMK